MSDGSDLVKARGDVRDSIAMVENFLQVLASRRVGTRALVTALPEVRVGFRPLLFALVDLERALAVELATDAAGIHAVHELLSYGASRVEDLNASLANFDQDALDARARLAIEAVVRPVAGDLRNVMRLVDMLGPKVGLDSTTIDFDDALTAAARRSPVRLPATPVLAVIEGPTRELCVRSPQLVVDLLEFAVATVVRNGVNSPRILVEPRPSGYPHFSVDEARVHDRRAAVEATRRALDVVLHDALPWEPEVVGAAARQAGIELSISEDGKRVTIAL